MAITKTAGLTAVWRQMSKVDPYAKQYTSLPTKIIGYILGKLDPNSVETIAQRTILIDKLLKKIKPSLVVEIGAGYSSRSLRFKKTKFYELDFPVFKHKTGNSIFVPFDIEKDKLNLNIKNAVFIVEGVSMYLEQKLVEDLLKQIKGYKGHLIIDFFNKEYSRKNKTIREGIFKLLFKMLIKRDSLFNYKIKNIAEGKALLHKLGFKNVRSFNYNINHTLDVLFCAEI